MRMITTIVMLFVPCAVDLPPAAIAAQPAPELFNQEIRTELASYEQSTLSRREHINRLQADLKSLEEEAKRLSAASPSLEAPGDRLRAYVGDGDRQYLTGLKVGGERILILLDASASMLGATIVNVIRRRNLPEEVRIRSPKWQQAVSTVDWLTTQFPRDSRFQI